MAQLAFNPYLLERLGLAKPPSYSILQQSLKRVDTQLFHRMIRLLARMRPPPENVAADSTGFSHTTGGEWMSLRFNKTRIRRFTALHAAVDTDTLLVHTVRVRARPGGDAKEMISLLNQVPTQNIKNIYGDKGYISRRNVQHIHDLGAYPAIEPKKNAKSRAKGYPAYGRLVREYQRDPEE